MDRATLVLAGHPQAARGRALTEQLQAWSSAFGALLPERRPLAGLDVGSGTGRFTPALARAFGPVTGVEPSVRMREIAQAQSQHPGVRHLAGSAEDMPVPSGSADYAVMLQSWHHVQDKPRAARELARVLRPAGCYCAPGSATTCPGFGGWSTSPAALRWTPRCFSRRTRSSRHSRRPAGALPASARSPNRPPTTRTTSPQPAVF
ncbi:MAG: class I SAM-dependent methyltransferase [Actinomycetes bacterium]